MKTFAVVLLAVFMVCQTAKLPDNIQRCKLVDAPCFEKAVGDAIRIMKDGNPKINLIRIEPLHVTAINIDTGAGNFHLKLNLIESDISGLSALKDIKIESKSDEYLYWIMKGFLPKVEVEGKYKADGQVLILPITGEGKSNLTLHDVEATLVIKGSKRIEKKGKQYMQLEQFDVSFNPKLLTMQFENLFNGDKTLGDQMNLFLNENWQEIFKEVRPALEESLGAIFMELTNRVFAKIPLEDIYL